MGEESGTGQGEAVATEWNGQHEQQAALVVKKMMDKMRFVSPETFDHITREIHAQLPYELANCGNYADQTREEVANQVEQVRLRMEDIKDSRAGIFARKAIQKIRLATPDTFEELQRELESTLQQELPNCG